MAESNADVYASFGVNSAVMSGSTPTEHEQNMLALDVATRDGDDEIKLVENDDPYGNPDKFADPNEDNGFMQVRIGADASEESDVEIVNNGQEVETEGETDGEAVEFETLGETPDELTKSSDQLGNYEEGLQEMIDTAAERGLSEADIVRIQEEYQGDGITDESFEALAKAGYSRAFVESYIQGQESLVQGYIDQVKSFAGGADKFDKLMGHLETTNPEAAESLVEALEGRNLSTVKAILNLAGQSYNTKFGKKAERTITSRANPAPAPKAQAEGFETQAEMIKAMSDPRYRSDNKYRREVEQKVINSKF